MVGSRRVFSHKFLAFSLKEFLYRLPVYLFQHRQFFARTLRIARAGAAFQNVKKAVKSRSSPGGISSNKNSAVGPGPVSDR